MKQMNKTKKKVFIILLLACVVIGAFGAYAALSTSGTEKRVIAARTKDITDSNVLRFSSNYLSPYESSTTEYGVSPISVSSDSDATIGITICNYPQDNPSLTNNADITYQISMTILNSDSNESTTSITINPSGEATLTGKTRSVQVHKITIPKDQITEISKGYIQVIARPVGASLTATGSRILAAKIQIVPASTRATAWVGVNGDNNVDFEDLDAYNYQISGTEQCTLTLSWKADLVALSDWSIQMLKPDANDDDITGIKKAGSITFTVGGQDQPTSYMLQFYRVGKKQSSFDQLGISLVSSSNSTTGEN